MVDARKTNFSIGSADTGMTFKTSNQMPDPRTLGFTRTVLNQKAKDDLRRVNFVLGNEPDSFVTTAQASYNQMADRAKTLLSEPAKLSITAKESHVYIGNQDEKMDWRSTNQATYSQKDTKAVLQMVNDMKANGDDNYKPHFTFGHDAPSYRRSNLLPAPVAGKEYKPPPAIKSDKTNWTLGSQKNNWQSESQALNSSAKQCPDLVDSNVKFALPAHAERMPKPQSDNNKSSVLFGRDEIDYRSEQQKNFKVRSQERDFAKEARIREERQKTLQKSNITLGGGHDPSMYSRSSQLFDPQIDGMPAPEELRAAKSKISGKTNFNLGNAPSDWKTETMKSYYDNDEALQQAVSKAASSTSGSDLAATIRKSNFTMGDDVVRWQSSAAGSFTMPPKESYSADKQKQKDLKKALASSNFKFGVPGYKDQWSSTSADQMGGDAAEKYKPQGAAAAQMKQLAANLRQSNFDLGSDKTNYASVANSSFIPHGKVERARPKADMKDGSSNFSLGYAKTDYSTSGIS